MTFDELQKVNETISKIPLKGKEYAECFQRVKAFRMLFPMGCIETDIVSLTDGMVVMKATARDENGEILGTGLRYEREGSSNVNRTSFIENCETSRVARALAFVGIGIDLSIASREEMINAAVQELDMKKPKPQPKREEPPIVELQWQNRKCEICGKDVRPNIAKGSFKKYGHIFCSGECKQRFDEGATE